MIREQTLYGVAVGPIGLDALRGGGFILHCWCSSDRREDLA
ncbi:hypothetical protein [Streptomyces sp. NPDC054849]